MLVRPFKVSVNYVAYDQQAGLFVASEIWEVSTGTPVFVQKLPLIDNNDGTYINTFTPILDKQYLTISCVYTDGTYSTVFTDRPPAGGIFDCAKTDTTKISFAYGAYDLSETLNIQATINDMTSGIPIFAANVVMVHVSNGFYFGQYIGANSSDFSVKKIVYTDNTYAAIDTDRSFDVETFQTFDLINVINEFKAAQLKGQKLNSIIIGQELNAILREVKC